MKIPVKNKSLEKVMAIIAPARKKPRKPNFFLKWAIMIFSKLDLWKTHARFNEIGMERLGKKEPALILMNHSSFIDLEMAEHYFYPRSLSIVCTSDGFVGKEWLMRMIGCIPTQKFVPDMNLIRDMSYALKTLKTSVLMYPEASYSFDGTATPLPQSLGGLVKILKVPVVTVITHGNFLRDPLYNGLQIRKTNVSADVKYLISPEEAKSLTEEEINEKIQAEFSFDNFAWQKENGIKITEKFRADYLNRVLYKCPHCMTEGKTEGKGITLRCKACGVSYTLCEDGSLSCDNAEAKFTHIPDWYKWEREEVRGELERGEYKLDIPVDIKIMADYKAIYSVGEGRLVHDGSGFSLTGCDGGLEYHQSPIFSYSLYADYFWYEIGDVICIGDKKHLYYCFPRGCDVVAKTRLAAEELYKLKKSDRKEKTEV